MESLIRFGYDIVGTPKAGALVVLLFVYLVKVIRGRIDRGREERSVRISEMLAEIEKNKTPRYHFTVEQVFQNRFGFLIDYPVINFFLKSKTPTADILAYLQARRYIEFCNNYESLEFKKYVSQKTLRTKKFILLAAYFFSSSIGLILIVLMPLVPFDSSPSFALYLVFIVASLMWGYLSVDEAGKPDKAISLVEKYGNPKQPSGLFQLIKDVTANRRS